MNATNHTNTTMTAPLGVPHKLARASVRSITVLKAPQSASEHVAAKKDIIEIKLVNAYRRKIVVSRAIVCRKNNV